MFKQSKGMVLEILSSKHIDWELTRISVHAGPTAGRTAITIETTGFSPDRCCCTGVTFYRCNDPKRGCISCLKCAVR